MENRTPPARILITGYSGFAGSYLVEVLARHYLEAQLFGLSEQIRATATPVRPLLANITDAQQVRVAVAEARPDLVFHLAAQASVAASWRDPAQTLAVNAGGTIHLCEALRAEAATARLVLIGSGEQYGAVPPDENPIREEQPFRPLNPYAVSKAAQDLYGYQYYAAHGLPVLRVRAFNHFGPRQPAAFVIASFARQIAEIEAGHREPVLLVGNLEAQRDFLPVADVMRAYLAVAERGLPGEAYNVGSGTPRSIASILDTLLSLASRPIAVRSDPARMRPADAPLLVADTTRLRTHTGWAPEQPFADALRQTLDYWRATIASA